MKMYIIILLICTTSLASGDTFEGIEQEDNQATLAMPQGFVAPIKTKTVEDVPGLSEDLLLEAIVDAKKETMESEAKTPRNKQLTDIAPNTHYKRFVPELEHDRINALIMEKITRKLAKKLDLTSKDAALQLQGLKSEHLEMLKSEDSQQDSHDCNRPHFKYRTITGCNNNPLMPLAGSARTRFTRLLSASYYDGISIPRRAKNGNELTNARKVSSVVFKEKDLPSPELSHMNMLWGQFLDHDIDHGAQPNIDCSKTCGLSGECFGIPVPQNDKPFENKTCINLKRDVPVSSTSVLSTTREQVNVQSSFVDASQIYGDDIKRFKELRESGTPFLIERRNPSDGLKDLLPKLGDDKFCRTPNKVTMPCFKSGDMRTNENPGLSSLHTMWSREHNRIAKTLQFSNPHWSIDKVFFETRQIVGAMLQHITYNEYIPTILDAKTRQRFDLELKTTGFYKGYNRNIDASIFNAFAGAAFRFGHSQIPNMFNRFHKNYVKKASTKPIPMNRFFDPTFLYNAQDGGVDSIMRGLVRDSSQKTDGFFDRSVQEQLVRGPNDLSDLPALNIQRGREHGLPGYNFYRQLAGLEKVDTFSGFNKKNIMTLAQIKTLQMVYAHPDDVDLFVGGLYEKHVQGGIMGPTFSVLLAEQFRRLRKGDRFWYENKNVFTEGQLQEIRKSSLARVICDNSDDIKHMQRFAIRKPDLSNPVKACSQLPELNLSLWQEGCRRPRYRRRRRLPYRYRVRRLRARRYRVNRRRG